MFQVYDTTLRDGAQQEGINLSVADKLLIAPLLDELGVGVIEGGWPGAVPKDTEFFKRAAKELDLKNAELAAFGATRKVGVRASDDPDQIVSNSVFGDGAAAAVVTAGGSGLRLDRFTTTVVPEGASEMAWNIGDEGFEMVLSTAVPKLIGEHVARAVAPLLGDHRPSDVPVWAVHPGGRAILDRTAEALDLPEAALAPSRAVLRRHGNMSSATVLFVLDEAMRGDDLSDGDAVVALAFGPGLTVESARLTVATTGRP